MFSDITEKNVQPDSQLYTAIITACVKLADYKTAKQVLEHMDGLCCVYCVVRVACMCACM